MCLHLVPNFIEAINKWSGKWNIQMEEQTQLLNNAYILCTLFKEGMKR
jgi:hypothetical protein